jgi:Protein of unknown function (DUF2808)
MNRKGISVIQPCFYPKEGYMLTSMNKKSLKSVASSRLLDFMILFAGMMLPNMLASAQALPLSNGKTVFEHSPRLVKMSTSLSQTRALGAKYQFAIAVPQDAGASLKAIIITQPENRERINYEVNQSKAFAGELTPQGSGDRITQKTEVSLASVGGSPSPEGEVTIVFDRPIPPGKAVTVELSPRMNPNEDGVYLFGITAYPEGQNSSGLFLGYSRLTFYGPR